MSQNDEPWRSTNSGIDFFLKGQMIQPLDFTVHKISGSTIQVWPCSGKSSHIIYMNKYSCSQHNFIYKKEKKKKKSKAGLACGQFAGSYAKAK